MSLSRNLVGIPSKRIAVVHNVVLFADPVRAISRDVRGEQEEHAIRFATRMCRIRSRRTKGNGEQADACLTNVEATQACLVQTGSQRPRELSHLSRANLSA